MNRRPIAVLIVATCTLAPVVSARGDAWSDANAAAEAGNYALAVSQYESALDTNPQLANNTEFTQAKSAAESMQAYGVGVRLHRDGEFEAAIEQFFIAIGKDTDNSKALAALTDAQFAAARQHFDQAIASADTGDLLSARQHLERARELSGGNESITTALLSITQPQEALDEPTLKKLADAEALAKDLQWQLAAAHYEKLIADHPLLLPARSGLHRAHHFRDLANGLYLEGQEHLAGERLKPAAEALSGATAIWPYHPEAGDALERVQARIDHALELTQLAQAQLDNRELQAAYDTAQQARAADVSSGEAQSVLRDATRQLAQFHADAGVARIAAREFDQARDHFVKGFEVSQVHPALRRGMASWHVAQAKIADDADQQGLALLHTLAVDEYKTSIKTPLSESTQRALLRKANATYRLRVGGDDGQIGVSGGQLADAIASRDKEVWLSTAEAEGSPRFLVNVQITESDVSLRRTGSVPYYDTLRGVEVGFNGWEKRGTLTCDLAISDPQTGEIIDRWQENRWTSHTDRQQFVVGSTWQNSYWTLPGDDEIEALLAREMAREVWPRIRKTMTAYRMAELLQQAEALTEEGDAAAALERRVTAAMLEVQLDQGDGLRTLKKLMQAHANPAGPVAE